MRLFEALRAAGYWRDRRPDVQGFCRDRGYRPQYVYAWLRGRVPGPANLTRLCRDLGVSRAWLLLGEGEQGYVDQVVQAFGAGPSPAARSGRADRTAPRGRRRPEAPPGEPRSDPGEGPGPAARQVLDLVAPLGRLRALSERLAAAERALRESEERVRSVIETAGSAIVAVSPDGRVADWNQQATQLSGRRREDALGQRLVELLLPAGARAGFEEALRRVLGGQPIRGMEEALHTVEGQRLRVLWNLSPLRDASGQVRGALAIGHDITALKQTEEALRLSQSRLDLALSGLPMVFYGARATDNFAALWLTGDVERVTGFPAEVFLRDPHFWLRRVRPEDRPGVMEAFAALRSTGRILVEYRWQVADGSYRWLWDEAVLVPGAEGEPDQMVGIWFDVTERRRAGEAARILGEAAQRLTGSLLPWDARQRAVEAARHLLSTRRAVLYEWEPATDELRCTALAGPPLGLHQVGAARPVDGSITALTLREGVTLASRDVFADPRLSYPPALVAELRRHDPGLGAAASAPLRLSGQVVGVLVVGDRQGRSFTDAELQLLQALADHAVAALSNARLYVEAERRRREEEALAGVARAMAEAPGFEVAVARALDSALGLLRVGRASLWLQEPDGALVAVASEGPIALPFRPGTRMPPGTGLGGRAVQEGAVLQSPDILADASVRLDPALRDVVDRLGSRAVLAVPLRTRGRIIGVLVLGDVTGRRFSESEVALARALADQVAAALETSRLLGEREEEVRRLSVLHELSRAATERQPAARLAETIRGQVGRVLDARNLVVALYDADRDEVEVILRLHRGEPDARVPRRYPRGRGLLARVLAGARPVRTADYAAACRREGVEPVPASLEFPHWLGVPMVVAGRVVGALVLRSAERPFSEEDERLLASIANVAALAVSLSAPGT
jgi:PAS domain S-box-containing protein